MKTGFAKIRAKYPPERWLGRAVPVLLLALAPGLLAAQPTGGRAGLGFLQLPVDARLAALGTRHFTLPGPEATLFLQNPARLDSAASRQLGLSVLPYLADTRLFGAAYAHRLGTRGTGAAGIQYLNYGTMVETDDLGNPVGEFRAADYALSAGYGHTVGNITLGGALKMVGSSLGTYRLWGLAVDWGGTFRHPRRDLTAGFVVKNMGFLTQNYAGGDPPRLPLDVRLGLSFKPEYVPLRISLTAHHLHSFDLVYNDPALFFDFDANGNRIERKIALPEKLLRHLTLGVEVLLHPNFGLLAGYDHLARQELRLQTTSGLAGLSWGAWIQVRRFRITFGGAQRSPGLGFHSFSLGADLKK